MVLNKLKNVKCHVRNNLLKFYLNESLKALANPYKWICVKNKFKKTNEIVSNDCSQNIDYNNEGLISKFLLVSSKTKLAL